MVVSLPFGSGEEYDLILDNQGKLYRVQVKSVHDRAMNKNGYHVTLAGYHRMKYSRVDLFAVCMYNTGLIYLIPTKEIPGRDVSLNPYSPTSRFNKFLVNGVPDYI